MILKSFGWSYEELRPALIDVAGGRLEGSTPARNVPPRVMLLLEAGASECIELADEEVSSEHVLIALSRQWEEIGLASVTNVSSGLMVRERAIWLTDGLDSSSLSEAPGPPINRHRKESVQLAADSTSRESPYERQPWGSRIFVDGAGKPMKDGRRLLQYMIDREGRPIKTMDNRYVHLSRTADGRLMRDEEGNVQLIPVDVPDGAVLDRA